LLPIAASFHYLTYAVSVGVGHIRTIAPPAGRKTVSFGCFCGEAAKTTEKDGYFLAASGRAEEPFYFV
jgi:hypothetical protein